ncbi:MAG: hypothetical protein ACP5KA_04025 [Desulfurococcaceae archaeon]
MSGSTKKSKRKAPLHARQGGEESSGLLKWVAGSGKVPLDLRRSILRELERLQEEASSA